MTVKLTETERFEIKRELGTGEDRDGNKINRNEIAERHNITNSHLSRLSKKWGLQQKDVMGELIDTGKANKEVENAATRALIKENKERLEQILQTGKFCLDEFSAKAKGYGYTNTHDFLSMTVDFWLTNHQELEELQEDLVLANSVVSLLMREVDPELARIRKERKIEEIVQMQLIKTGTIQDGLLEEYLRG